MKSVENIFYNDTKYPDFELSRFEIREFQKNFLFRSGTSYKDPLFESFELDFIANDCIRFRSWPHLYLYRDTYYQTIDEAESVMRDYVDTITTYQPYEI